jgi:hypothetical protein
MSNVDNNELNESILAHVSGGNRPGPNGETCTEQSAGATLKTRLGEVRKGLAGRGAKEAASPAK